MPTGVAAGRRRVWAVLHPRTPCSRKAVRCVELRELFPVLLPTARSEVRQCRTSPADRYRQFSLLTVAGRNRTTSHGVSEIPSRSAQICCEVEGGSCSPAAGGKVSSS